MSFQEQSIPDDERVTYQEKRAIVSLFSMVLISAIYFLYVSQRYPDGDAYSKAVFQFWGSTILILVPVSIVANIIIYIVFSIINTIATQETEPSVSDERDHLIELRTTRNAMFVFITGFFLAMGSVAFDMIPSVMFIIIIVSGLTGSIVAEVSNLYYYRRGF